MTPFDQLAPVWVLKLRAEFGLTIEQACGLLGNLGYESDGFQKLQEVAPVAGRGGLGVAQWTASRRIEFENWCKGHKLDTHSDDGNYGYLVEELRGPYHDVIESLMHCSTVDQATWSVGQTYERPGGTTKDNLPGYDGRLHWARRALAGAQSGVPATPPAPAQNIAPVPSARDLQAALVAAGAGIAVDGIWGDQSAQALYDFYHKENE